MGAPFEAMLEETAALREDLEKKRQIYFRLFIMGAPMVFAAICAIAAMNTDHGVFPWPIVLISTLILVTLGFQVINGLYRRQTKIAFLERIATSLGLEYHRNGVFPVHDMEHHKILPIHDIYRIEDGFYGSMNGVTVAFEEITLSDKVRHRNPDGTNEDREETVFWGLGIKIGIGKTLDSHTVVLPRIVGQSFFRTLFSKFEKINLVSPKFEERYDVFSTSQVEARYVLDPAFMERFMEAGDIFGAKWMQVSFKGNEIAFAVQRNRPMFEIGWVFKPLTPAMLEAVTNEIRAVLSLIDVLKLNPHTGLGAALPGRDKPQT